MGSDHLNPTGVDRWCEIALREIDQTTIQGVCYVCPEDHLAPKCPVFLHGHVHCPLWDRVGIRG